LLHDIGKAIDQEAEGPHAVIGAQTARKFGESPRVIHAIEAHHGDVAPTDVIAHLVDAANVLSGQRPGARREMLESYVQRLHDLEKIADQLPGRGARVRDSGRQGGARDRGELSRVSDDQARLLSKDIARRVESDLSYPGQIRSR
jgi:ribonuclease Y